MPDEPTIVAVETVQTAVTVEQNGAEWWVRIWCGEHMTTHEDTARTCIHTWQVWAWTGILDPDFGRLYLRAECLTCGTVSQDDVPIAASVGARLPGQGALQKE